MRFFLLLSAGLALCAITQPARTDVPIGDPGEIRGRLVLTVASADPGAFGYRTDVPSSFEGWFRIMLNDPPAEGRVPDGDYEGTFVAFNLVIGDTMWDATMPHTPPLVRFADGLAIGYGAIYTDTRPEHPDLILELPASPGIWNAIDDDGVTNNGIINGTYRLEPAFSAVPVSGFWSTLALVTLLLVAAGAFLGAMRRQPA